MTGGDRRPTTSELLDGAIRTIEDVLLPDLQSAFARSTATLLAGQLRYALARLDDESLATQTDELAACLDTLCAEFAALREVADAAPTTGDAAVDTRERAGRLLAHAVGSPDGDDAGRAVRERLRPLLVAQLQSDMASATPLLHAFLAAGSVGSAR